MCARPASCPMTSVPLRAVCMRAQPILTSLLASFDYFGVSVAPLGLSGDCAVWCSLDLAIGTGMNNSNGKGGRFKEVVVYHFARRRQQG